MPPDGPTVDLNLGPAPQSSAPSGIASNPLGALSTLAGTQNQLNQNRLFQQQFQARQRLGQIIASAPDLESGWAAAQRDPLVAPFAGEAYAAFRQGQLNLQQLHNEQQQNINLRLQGQGLNLENQGKSLVNAKSGMDVVMKALGASGGDYTAVPSLVESGLATLPPAIRAQDGPAVKSLLKSLTVGLPDPAKDPQGFQAGYEKNLFARMAGSGILDPAAAAASQNKTIRQNVQYPGGGYGQIGGVGAPAAQPASSAATSTTEPPVGFDGKPLLAPPTVLPPPSAKDQNGIPIRPPEVQSAVDAAGKKFQEDQPLYDAAAQTTARLENVADNLRTLARGGGFQTPGAAGVFRSNIVNAINTASQVINPGAPPPFDPTKQAAAEDTMKETAQLGFNLASQAFGSGGHQALGTLHTALTAVPGIENTPLGGMLVSDMLKASTQWLTDKRTFLQDFAQRSNYDLRGAETAFAQLHPPSGYVGQVLQKYGLTPKGFASQGDVVNAYKDGIINGKIAYETLRQKGWISQKVYDAAKAAGFPDQTPQGQ